MGAAIPGGGRGRDSSIIVIAVLLGGLTNPPDKNDETILFGESAAPACVISSGTDNAESDSLAVKEIVEDVESDTVTEKRLTKSGSTFTGKYPAEKPVLARLEMRETPEFILSSTQKGLEYDDGARSEQIKPHPGYSAFAVITDDRLLYIVGQDDGDWTEEIAFRSITKVGWHKSIVESYIDV